MDGNADAAVEARISIVHTKIPLTFGTRVKNISLLPRNSKMLFKPMNNEQETTPKPPFPLRYRYVDPI